MENKIDAIKKATPINCPPGIPPLPNYGSRTILIPLLITAAVLCTTNTDTSRPGIMASAYEVGIKYIDRHPKLKNSRVGNGVRKGLVSLLIGNALNQGMSMSERRRVPVSPPVHTVMVMDRGKTNLYNNLNYEGNPLSAYFSDGLEDNY